MNSRVRRLLSTGMSARVQSQGASFLARDRVASVNLWALARNREVMDDDGLIFAVAGVDDAALRELFCRHAPWLAARLRGVLPAADVEDVLQETFLGAWRGAAGYRPEG